MKVKKVFTKTNINLIVIIVIIISILSGYTLNSIASGAADSDNYTLSQCVEENDSDTTLKLEAYLNNPNSVKSNSYNYNFLIDLSSNVYSVYDDSEPVSEAIYDSWLTPTFFNMMYDIDKSKHYYYGVRFEVENNVYPLDYRNDNWYFYLYGWNLLENVHIVLDRNELPSGFIKIYKNSVYSLLIDNITSALKIILKDNTVNGSNSTVSIYGYNGNCLDIVDNQSIAQESDIDNIIDSIMQYEPAGSADMETLTEYVNARIGDNDVLIELGDIAQIENLENTVDSYVNPVIEKPVLKISFDNYYKELLSNGELNINIYGKNYNKQTGMFDEDVADVDYTVNFNESNDLIEISDFDYDLGTKLIIEIPIEAREGVEVNNRSLRVIDDDSGLYEKDGTVIKLFDEYLYEKHVKMVVTGNDIPSNFLIPGFAAMAFIILIIKLYRERD